MIKRSIFGWTFLINSDVFKSWVRIPVYNHFRVVNFPKHTHTYVKSITFHSPSPGMIFTRIASESESVYAIVFALNSGKKNTHIHARTLPYTPLTLTHIITGNKQSSASGLFHHSPQLSVMEVGVEQRCPALPVCFLKAHTHTYTHTKYAYTHTVTTSMHHYSPFASE